MKTIYKRPDFGRSAYDYDKYRPRYPKKIISTIFKTILEKNPIILDLGCGTGIGTRQIAKKGKIFGIDKDYRMLKVARSYKSKNIKYKIGRAEKIPFKSESFDAITIFTAFHWFVNKKAISEMKRVLKKNGKIIIIQPRSSETQKKFRSTLEKLISKKIPRRYKIGKDFIPTLTTSGLVVSKVVIKSNISYNVNNYVRLLTTYSYWNYVPKKSEKEVMSKLISQFKQGSKIEYIKNIEIIIASKKN